MDQPRGRYVWMLAACLAWFSPRSLAQCPPNLGFEQGDFDRWQCSSGEIKDDAGAGLSRIILTPGNPDNDIHSIQGVSIPVALDRYGLFPTVCPNGGKFSIRLGNETPKRKAQQVSYTFTIPADDDNYSIIYNYAVVFQNPPDHKEYEQPRFTADVFDVTDNKYIGCSSFSYAAFGDLKSLGFQLATTNSRDVYYKGWTPVTIKLSGYAGKTIRLEFTSNDCTKGGHFGYAYVDVNQNCANPVSGSTQCLNDTLQMLSAPFGFQGYRWFTDDFSKQVGTGQRLDLKPAPAPGTKFAVEITPFPQQGCVDTVYTVIGYNGNELKLKTPPGEIVSCVSAPVDLTSPAITTGSSTDLSFEYFADAALTKYLATPRSLLQDGVYYIKATNSSGCVAATQVKLRIADFPVFSIATPPLVRRPAAMDITQLPTGNTAGLTFTYWKDSLATQPLHDPVNLDRGGRYFIKATIEGGCSEIFGVNVNIEEALLTPPNAFSPNGDGVNDTWEIPLLAGLYPNCTVSVFNRLGQVVFQSTGYGKSWDGKYKGLDQPVGTYYYVIRPRADLPAVGGSITIIR